MADETPGHATVNAILTDWASRPQDGPFSAVVEQDGARWELTAHAEEDGWLRWRAELGGLGPWGLGRRIVSAVAAPPVDA